MRNRFLKISTLAFLFLVFAATLMLVACSEKEEKILEPPPLSDTPDRVTSFPPQTHEYPEEIMKTLPTVYFSNNSTYHDELAVPITYFITKDYSENNGRRHSFQIVSYDNTTSRREGNKDLTYSEFQKGDFLTDRGASYFHELSTRQIYLNNVNRAIEIRWYRSIVVVRPNGDEVLFQVNILNHSTQTNPQDNNNRINAFKLQDLITDYITKTKENYEYHIYSADNSTTVLQWHDLQTAYNTRGADDDRVFYPTKSNDVPEALRPRNITKIVLASRNIGT